MLSPQIIALVSTAVFVAYGIQRQHITDKDGPSDSEHQIAEIASIAARLVTATIRETEKSLLGKQDVDIDNSKD